MISSYSSPFPAFDHRNQPAHPKPTPKEDPVGCEIAALMRLAELTDKLRTPGLTINDRARLMLRLTSARQALAHAKRINQKQTEDR